MKKLLLFIVFLMPFVLFSQNKFNKEDINIALDTEIDGSRCIATGKVQVSQNGRIPLTVYLMQVHTNKGKEYSLGFSCRSYERLYIKKGKPVLFKYKTGKVLTLKTDEDIDQHYGFMVEHDLYTNNIGFLVTRKQIKDIIQGKVVKVRLTTDDAKTIDFNIENNILSEVLSLQLNAIDDQVNTDIYKDF